MGRAIKTAFFLTAGVGSRLRPHTDKKPKPCLPFAGLPLMNYGAYLALQAGYVKFLFNQHHLPEELEKTIHSYQPYYPETIFKDEKAHLLGSGGAIWNAKKDLKDLDHFLIANGDEILIPQDVGILDDLYKTFQQSESLCTLLLCEHPELLKTLKAVWVDDSGHVQGFGMKSPRPGLTPLHYTGYKIFSNKIFDYLPDGESNIFYDVLVKAIAQGEKVSSHKINCDWHETGNFKSFVEATTSVLKNNQEYLQTIHRFFKKPDFEILQNDNSILLKPKNLILPDDFKWRGVVTLAENMKIGKSVSLQNCFCEEGVSIASQSQLTDQFIFAN